jgi:hypothetical protein
MDIVSEVIFQVNLGQTKALGLLSPNNCPIADLKTKYVLLVRILLSPADQ